MPEGKEEQVGDTPPPETQTRTYTQEELDAETARVRQEELEKYQGIQRTIAKKDQEIERLRKQAPEPTSSDDRIAEIILQEKKRRQAELGEVDPTIPQLEAELAERKRRAAQATQFAKQEAIVKDERAKLDKKITDAGLDPNDDRFLDVDESFNLAAAYTGNFEIANKKLDRILKQVKPKGENVEKPKEGETEAEKIDRLAEEKARKMLEEKGLLTTETGGPSASSPSVAEARAKFARGEITEEEAKKAGVEFV